MKIKVAFGY